MADARALLRAHRAENRIKHPHAAYSDAGKLICKICHEIIRTEALWEAHINGPNHQRRFQVLQAQPGSGYYVEESIGSGNGDSKRKYDDLSDTDDDFGEYDMPRKRGRLDTSGPTTAGSGNKRESPPTLNRRASNTPLHGVEIAIPSRPATPAAGSNSATSTPKGVPVGRSPLIGSEAASTTTTTQQNAPISTQAVAGPSTTATATTTQAAPDAVDAAEWAAFEAEMALASEPASTTATAPASALAAISSSATISAPALSAAQLAAKSEEEEHERRKHLLDAQIADEREDAKLAFAAEMEEMEELEGRVRRLKERREELRKGSVANLRGAAAATATATSTTAAGTNAGADVVMAKGPTADGKENNGGTIHEEDEEDDEEDEEDDGWSAFRFR